MLHARENGVRHGQVSVQVNYSQMWGKEHPREVPDNDCKKKKIKGQERDNEEDLKRAWKE